MSLLTYTVFSILSDSDGDIGPGLIQYHCSQWQPDQIVIWYCVSLLSHTIFSVLSEADGDIGPGYSIIVPKGNLTCHECYRSIQGESCITMENLSKMKKQKCAVDELFCVVRYPEVNNSTVPIFFFFTNLTFSTCCHICIYAVCAEKT